MPTLVIRPTVVPAFRQRSGWRPSGVEPVAPRSTGAPPAMNLARLVGLVLSKPRCRRMEYNSAKSPFHFCAPLVLWPMLAVFALKSMLLSV